jgi:hypothetical protein
MLTPKYRIFLQSKEERETARPMANPRILMKEKALPFLIFGESGREKRLYPD